MGSKQMDHREELEQQLWEFVFDLLSPEQARAIRERITSDPEAARLYAETKLQAEIVGEAVKLRHPPIALVPPDPNADAATAPGASSAPVQQSRRFPTRQLGNWFITVAAVLLMCYLGYAYYRPASPIRDVAIESAESALVNQPVHTTVLGAEQLQPSSANYFTVLTKTATGRPREAEVNARFYSADGEIIDSTQCRTDSNGVGQLRMAGFTPLDSVRMVVSPAAIMDDFSLASVNFSVRDNELSTHLTSDRSLYRPNESVRYRSVTLSRYDLQTPSPTSIDVAVLDSQGELVEGLQQTVETSSGVGSGSFALPAELPAGQYELVARSPENLFPEVRRAIQVRSYTAPKLKKRLDFALDSFSPGEPVVADLSVERADGQIVRNAPLEIVAQLDDAVHYNLSTATDDQGKYRIRFDLPQQLAFGEGLLQVTIGDDLQEQIVEPIPIHVKSASVQFFPESGDLVAGVENRVYFFAHDPQDRPLHLAGQIVDDGGNDVTTVETLHDGRGVFSFTPAADQTYQLKLRTATTLTTNSALPRTSQRQFLTLNTGLGVFGADSPLEFELRSSRDDRLVSVTAVCRGRQVGQAVVPADQFAADRSRSCPVSMELDENASGVIRLTAYDLSAPSPEPIAERLVYRQPRKQLRLDVSGTTSGLTPGAQVDLTLRVEDEQGRGHPAVLGVSVVDEAALSLVRDDSASLTTHFWLTGQIDDVRGLEDANFYLRDDEQSARSLDLLLGTQGWRRFETIPPDQLAATGTVTPFGDTVALGEDALGVVVDEPTTPQLLADNEAYASGAVSREIESLYSTFESSLRRIGRVLFFGGLALVISLVLLAVMRRATAPVWIPALGAGALCLVLGGVWMAASIERSNPLAGVQTTDLKRSKGLAKVDAESIPEVATTRSELAEQKSLERYVTIVDEVQDQELPLVELQVMELELEAMEEELSPEFPKALGGRAMSAPLAPAFPEPAAPAPETAAGELPAPAAELGSGPRGQIEERYLGRGEVLGAESAEGVAGRSAVVASPAPEIADDEAGSTAGLSDEPRPNRRTANLGVVLESNDKPSPSRAIAPQQHDMIRLRAPLVDGERSAGIGGGLAGKQADSRVKAKKERFADKPQAGSLAERPMSRGLAEELPAASTGEKSNEPAETLAQDEQQPFGVRQREMEEALADADAPSAANEPQPSDEPQPRDGPMSAEFDVALDENELASAAPPAAAVRRLAAVPARNRDFGAEAGYGAMQGSSESAVYEFRPLVRRYTAWSSPQIGTDLTETVYWNPLLTADGDAPVAVSFRLSDAATSYRLLINGHGAGRLGSYRGTISTASAKPAEAEE